MTREQLAARLQTLFDTAFADQAIQSKVSSSEATRVAIQNGAHRYIKEWVVTLHSDDDDNKALQQSLSFNPKPGGDNPWLRFAFQVVVALLSSENDMKDPFYRAVVKRVATDILQRDEAKNKELASNSVHAVLRFWLRLLPRYLESIRETKAPETSDAVSLYQTLNNMAKDPLPDDVRSALNKERAKSFDKYQEFLKLEGKDGTDSKRPLFNNLPIILLDTFEARIEAFIEKQKSLRSQGNDKDWERMSKENDARDKAFVREPFPQLNPDPTSAQVQQLFFGGGWPAAWMRRGIVTL